MCGVVAAITFVRTSISEALELIEHRGPDAYGEYNEAWLDYNVAIGHRRLSIIDLQESANQPFFSLDRKIILSFNGEIYNFLELRKELEAIGSVFVTSSDTEVLLEAYVQWGEKSIEKLKGMFAFVLFDKRINQVFIGRDRLGIKPIYYSIDQKKQLFVASEIKCFKLLGIIPEIDRSQICEFLLNNWLYDPQTGFSNIWKVSPGTYIKFDLDKKEYCEIRYSDILENTEQKSYSYSEICTIVQDNIKMHLCSDVPVGIFFSGGNDSALISGLANKYLGITNLFCKYKSNDLQSASIFDDAPYAFKIAEILKINLIKCDFNFSNFGVNFEKIADYVSIQNEELCGDFTYLASELISELAVNKGFKVMLSGMGADEIFAGYPRYLLLRYYSLFKILAFILLPFRRLIKFIPRFSKKVDRFFCFFKVNPEENFTMAYSMLLGYFNLWEVEGMLIEPEEMRQVFKKFKELDDKISNLSFLKKGIYLDSLGFLQHNFIVADKSSMKKNVELRVPLATYEAFQYAFALPDENLINFFNSKLIIKQLLAKFVPKNLINRKKTGFNPPLNALLNETGYENFISEIRASPISKFLKMSFIEKLALEHFRKKEDNTFRLAQIIYLSKWLKNNVHNNDLASIL